MNCRKLAIVVVGFDGYKKLWIDFFNLFFKNWGDCQYNVYLITNEENFNYKNIKVITTSKDDEWSNKVRKALDVIEEEYICLLLEDFFVSNTVINRDIEEVMDFLIDNKIEYLKMPYKGQFSWMNREHYKERKEYFKIYRDEKYNITLLPSIWKKDFLKFKIGCDNYSPWQFEIDRINEAKLEKHISFDNCLETNSNVLNILNGVVQGKFLPTTVRELKKNGYELTATDFEVMSWKQYIVQRIKTYALFYIPNSLQKPIKYFLKLFNVKFVSEIRDERK